MHVRPGLVVPLALLAGLAAFAGPAPAGAAAPGIPGRIVFSSQDDLWSVRPGGTGLRRLTATPGVEEAQAASSPDGRLIAFRRRPDAGAPFQVYVMRADGRDVRRVGSSAFNDTQPGWSADGRRIVFRRGERGRADADVWSMAVDGTGATPLVVTPGADERYPVLSPDGRRLAFSSSRDGQYEIYVANADGSGQTRLTRDPGYDSAPSWSPGAARIAFERGSALDVDAAKDVWVMRASGAGQRRLTSHPGVDEGPAFSPDGRQIAFTSDRAGTYDPWRMRADGGGQTPVLALPTTEESPDWAPVPLPTPADVVGAILGPLLPAVGTVGTTTPTGR